MLEHHTLEEAVDARRRRVAQALGGHGPVVLIAAGQPIGKPGGLDQTYPFIPHPAYYWLTGSRRSGGVLAFDAAGGGFTHFVRPVTALERLWEGDPEAPVGEDVAGLDAWLEARGGRPIASLGASIADVQALADDEVAEIAERLDAARRPKDAIEVALVERAVTATAAGHARAREVIRPGATEREVQVELEAATLRAGADAMGYGTIVGAGGHAAVLHFDPGPRVIGERDLVLVDAGGSVHGYTADVTRTFPAGERFTPEQQAVYDVVLASEREGIARCVAGTEWHDVHRASARVLAEGLKDLGILRGDVEGLLESGAIALFFPHGIGHMVGLGVRDVGGRVPEREEGRICCGAKVRVDLPLRPGFLMTVEPGIYFVPAILDDPERRTAHADAVDWDGLARWRPVGGVRIEDDILVTEGGPRNLTGAIPK